MVCIFVLISINDYYFCPVIFIASGTVLITFITITVPLFIFLFYKWKKAAYKSNDDFNNYLFLIPHEDHSEDKDSKVEYASNNTGKMLIPVRT